MNPGYRSRSGPSPTTYRDVSRSGKLERRGALDDSPKRRSRELFGLELLSRALHDAPHYPIDGHERRVRVGRPALPHALPFAFGGLAIRLPASVVGGLELLLLLADDVAAFFHPLIGLFAGALGLLDVLGGGSLGMARLSDIGAPAGMMTLALLVELGVGAALVLAWDRWKLRR